MASVRVEAFSHVLALLSLRSLHLASRFVLILGWMMISFLLTISYKSVLLSNLISPSYESTIETVEDLLKTEKQILMLGNTRTSIRLKTDPRAKVRELKKELE